jgi:hypothetical protein
VHPLRATARRGDVGRTVGRIDSVSDPHCARCSCASSRPTPIGSRIWPRPRTVHHAYRSGLLEHILQIMKVSLFLADEYRASARSAHRRRVVTRHR